MDSSEFIKLIDKLPINPPSDSKPWYSKLFGWHPLFPAVDADSLASPAALEGISDGDEKQEIDVLTCPGVYIIAQFRDGGTSYAVPSEVDPLHERVVYVGQTSRDVDAPLRARLTEYRKALLYQDANDSNPGAYHSGGNTRRWKEVEGDDNEDRFDFSDPNHQAILASLHFAVYPIWFNDLLSKRGLYTDLYKLRVNALARSLEVNLIGQLAVTRGMARGGLKDYSCYDFVHNLDNRH